MDLRTVELSGEALKGIGRMLTPEQWVAPDPGAEYIYVDTDSDLGLEAPCSSGVIECAPRPKRLSRMERHLLTREALVALEGEAIVCIAPPQEGTDGELSGITAVRVRPGQAFLMERGAWHWIPFPVGTSPARFLVIFRSGTGNDDLYYHDLPRPALVHE
jgi:mannose-6-phosphate isomerase-like protein (cupin superfamily)